MAAALFFLPHLTATVNGIAQPGAKATFYLTGTSTKQPIYATSGLTTQLSNPITANAAGAFPSIYLDNSKAYRLVIADRHGTEILDTDPFIPGTVPDASALQPFADAAQASAAASAASALEAEAALSAAQAFEDGLIDGGDAFSAFDDGPDGASQTPRALSFGPRAGVRTLRKAVDLCDTIHTQIVGYAGGTAANNYLDGATGGLGKNKYLVSNESQDPSKPNSWPWAFAAAEADGGAIIHFETRGHFNIYLGADNRVDFNNLTVIAPGRNVTFWTEPLAGSFSITGENVIVAFIKFRTAPGTLAVYNDVTGTKSEQKLVAIDPTQADLIAFINCELRHASDGALDMTGLILSSTPQCRVSVINPLFWDTDQPMMLGSGDPLCTATDPPLLKVTIHNVIYAYCGERQPKVLGRTTVDMSNAYTQTLPFQRDQLAPTNEFSACYGADALYGGTLQARGCLWAAAVGGGYPALQVASAPNGAAVNVDGAVSATDCAAENGMTITTGNTGRIPSLPYTLAHDPVPAPGPDREAWINERWATCGAGPDAAPDGMFVWTADTTAYPNGETVLVQRGRGGRLIRIDAQSEFLVDGSGEGVASVESGNYVPTLTAVTNCSAPALDRATYERIGKRVTVSIVLDVVHTTAAAPLSVGIALPLARDFASTADIEGGCRVVSSTNPAGGYVNADATNDRAQATITPSTTSGSTVRVSANFSYMVA